MFKVTVAALSVALFLVPFGILTARNWPTPEQMAQKANSPKAPEVLAHQGESIREQLINRVIQPYNRMVYLCDYLAQFSYLVPEQQLPSKCADLRAAGVKAIVRMKTMKDLNLLSRQVNQFEITITPELRTMEATYAMAQRIVAK